MKKPRRMVKTTVCHGMTAVDRQHAAIARV